MYWTDLPCDDVIKNIYSQPPEINEICLLSLEVKRDNNSVFIYFEPVNALPDNPLPRWKNRDFDRVRMWLQCHKIVKMTMSGVKEDTIAKIGFESIDNLKKVNIINVDCNITITCSEIYLTNPSVY